MKQLTPRETQIMQIIWKLKSAFIREIIDEFSDEKPPHYNTVATLIKILEKKKGFLKSEKIGNTYRYSPTIDFEAYREEHLADIKEKFFENSFTKMMAHFAKKEELTDKEREELIRIIKSNEKD